MKAEDVDGELVDDAVDAWHEMPRPALLDDQMRHFLAAVLPRYEKQLLAERDALKAELADVRAAIERGQVARFAADVLRLVDDYSDEAQSIIARLPFLATFDQVCFEKYGIRTDELDALDAPQRTEDTREETGRG